MGIAAMILGIISLVAYLILFNVITLSVQVPLIAQSLLLAFSRSAILPVKDRLAGVLLCANIGLNYVLSAQRYGDRQLVSSAGTERACYSGFYPLSVLSQYLCQHKLSCLYKN